MFRRFAKVTIVMQGLADGKFFYLCLPRGAACLPQTFPCQAQTGFLGVFFE
jgi:hypothetical protein